MALFSIGQCVATPGALEALQAAEISPLQFLARHARGDWGDLSEGDKELNDEALTDGSRIFSAYDLPGQDQKIWIITEAEGDNGHRSSTCIMMADGY